MYILSIILGEVAPGSRAKDVKKSYLTRQRAAAMSNTSSGSKENGKGKARCRNGFPDCSEGMGEACWWRGVGGCICCEVAYIYIYLYVLSF